MTLRVLALLAVIAGAIGFFLKPPQSWKFQEPPKARVGTGAHFETVFTYASAEGTAHAPAIVRAGSGYGLIWFDGIRESHNDVKILGADITDDTVRVLLTRQQLSARFVPSQTILTLGNKVGDVIEGSYFATVVTLGGWAASSVAHVTGRHARKLNLSPVIGRSHLVKSPVIPMQDDKLLVPAYFELSDGYGVAALLDKDRRVIGQSIMRGAFSAIQPLIVPLSDREAVALLRRFGHQGDRLLASWTEDGGENWSAPTQLDLPNPGAPVAAIAMDDGHLLMLYNDAAQSAERLRFATSGDGGRTWAPGRVLDGPGKGALRYPMMQVLDDGRILATYSTHGKKGITAHVFSADWALQE